MKKTEWRGRECPPRYETRKNAGMLQLIMYIDERHENGEDNEEGDWVATQITMPVGVTDYGSIVSALINANYNNDQMQAIINNKLLDDGDVVHEETFQTMQAWRAESKRIAKEIVESID